MELLILPERFTLYRLAPGAALPALPHPSFIAFTAEETSVACPEGTSLENVQGESHGFAALRVAGTLDHSLIGILAGISSLLATVNISIFALSTWDTDYILIPGSRLADATAALQVAGYTVTKAPEPCKGISL